VFGVNEEKNYPGVLQYGSFQILMKHFLLLTNIFMWNHYIVNVAVFTVVSVKIAFFRNVTACSLVENYRFFQRNVLYFPLFAISEEARNLIMLMHL